MALSGIKNQVEEAKNTTIKNHLLVLPYKGEKEIHIFNSMKVCQQNSTRKILKTNSLHWKMIT